MMSWLDDFDKYLGTAGDVIEEVQKVIQPATPIPTTVPVTPKQAQQETKDAKAQVTDTSKPAIPAWAWLAGGAAVLWLLLE